MPFKVSKFPKVKVQITVLLARARALGLLADCRAALKRIQENLETRPLEWGDPEHNWNHPGGVAYHGIEEPFFVRYSVYEAEKAVGVFDIRALPTSPLAEE